MIHSATVKAYYSIILYMPDLTTREAACVGVLIVAPELPYFGLRLDPEGSRVDRFFGPMHRDRWFAAMSSVEGRLETLATNLPSSDWLKEVEEYIATRANAIQLTALRPMKLRYKPKIELDVLYESAMRDK